MKKIYFAIPIVAVAIVIIAAVIIVTGNNNKTGNKTRIICYGDSNTYGYNPNTLSGRYSEDVIWPAIMGDCLGEDYQVIECGKTGRTTAYDAINMLGDKNPDLNGLKQLESTLKENGPVDIMIIMLGANDCNVGMNLTVREITSGMEKLVTETRRICLEMQGYEPKIIIATPQAYGENYESSPLSYQMDEESYKKTHSLAEPFEALASKMGCYFFDASVNYEISTIDSQHLTEAGHKALGEDFAIYIKNNLL